MWKKCYSFAEQDYFKSMWNTFSGCLFRSAEITEAISIALYSVSYVLENFSGVTGFLSTPNGKNLKRLYRLFTSTYIPRIMITVYEIIYFWQT